MTPLFVNLDGIVAFLLFLAMGAFALVMIFVALMVKIAGKDKHIFSKLAMVSFVFTIMTICGFLLFYLYDNAGNESQMDNLCWIFLALAFIGSVIVLLKKRKTNHSVS
ncbi:MAG: hypothetical protein K0S32_1842 [Bacteroidetes bacterium]|jgi:cytochrome bd-type quinol oxidase subunit 2|nr:hypothetical protein [Bacteroidota bacterium]